MHGRSRDRWINSVGTRALVASAAAGLVALSGGCYSSTAGGGRAKNTKDSPAEAVAAGNEADADAQATNNGVSPEDIERTRAMMEQAFAALDGTVPGAPVLGSAGMNAAGPAQPVDTPEPRVAVVESVTPEPNAALAATTPQLLTLEELVAQASDLLAARARTSTDPAGDALALAALEAALPGLASRYLDAQAGDGADLGLSQSERRVVQAVRDAMEVLQSGRSEPGLAAQRLRQLASALETTEPMRIQNAALCTRVTGYGQYEPFAGTTFLAGRAQPMIVYVELDRFAHRDLAVSAGSDRPGALLSASEVDAQHAVEVAMTLELFLMSSSGISRDQPDALLVQRRPRAVDKRMSRNKLRDYYLVTRLDLPNTLRAGRYHLKITVEDLVGGGVAEEIVPIDLVADAALVTGSSR